MRRALTARIALLASFVIAPLAILAAPARASQVPFEPWRDLKASGPPLVDRQSQLTLALGAATLLGAKSVDGDAQSYFNEKRRLGDLDRLGNDVLGTGVPGVLLGAGYWAYGAWASQAKEAHAGQAQLEAIVATGVATGAIKITVQRERPDASDHFSFPSGHTSTTFATAGVLAEFYGWKAGVPAFLLAGLTGASRLSANKHWFSDVVGGGVLGLWIAHGFARPHLDSGPLRDEAKQSAKQAFFLVPSDDGLVANWLHRF